MLNILWGVAVLFAVLWILGFAFHVTMGGAIHVLLVLAVVVVVMRLIFGRRAAA
jgi:hypothetical protein